MALWVNQDYGGAIVKGQVLIQGSWEDFMPDTSGYASKYRHTQKGFDKSCMNGYRRPSLTDRVGLPESSFVMAPYSNRLENGVLYSQGSRYDLDRASEHALHGDVWYRKTQLEKASKTKLTLTYDNESPPLNWPWKFAAAVTYEALDAGNFKWADVLKAKYSTDVIESALYMSLKLTNLSDVDCPLSGGFHPYFLKQMNHKSGNVGFSTAAISSLVVNGKLRLKDAGLPIDGSFDRSDPLLARLKHGFVLDEGAPLIDDCFDLQKDGAQVRNIFTIEYMSIGVRLSFWVESNISHLVLYNPLGPYFAVEPVGHANGSLGGSALGPNKTKELSFYLVYSKM